jgi:hypothetical protein
MTFFQPSDIITDINPAYTAETKELLVSIKKLYYKELPEQFAWHDNVTPYKTMHVITDDDQIIEGCFHPQHGVFYVKSNPIGEERLNIAGGNKKVYRFSQITHIEAGEWNE